MSFNIALTGINAAQKDLDATANNIANVLTIGFKRSRAEFADVYTNTTFGGSDTLVGNGVKASAVAQIFAQGSLEATDNALDMAVSGTGFFILADSLTDLNRYFTRAGMFKLNEDNYVVTNEDRFVQAYDVNTNGVAKAVAVDSTQALQINDTAGQPTPTTEIDLALNLSSSSAISGVATSVAFDVDDDATYTTSTAITVFDSLGESHIVNMFFVKWETSTPALQNQWRMYSTFDNTNTEVRFNPASTTSTADDVNFLTIQFDTAGTNPTIYGGTSTANTLLQTSRLGTDLGALTNGSNQDQVILFDFDEAATTQFASASAIELSTLKQDGTTTGRLTDVDIGSDGIVRATYSNGTALLIGQIALARFANDQGLTQVGDTTWVESLTSGEALAGQGNSGVFGRIESSNLEVSNVNLSSSLVDLITAQRNYQANSRTLEVNSTLQQTLLQIR